MPAEHSSAPSWAHLAEENQATALPADLQALDPFGARDVGWVEQMRPFIEGRLKPGQWVLDPFCGFGSTLVAASLCGAPAVGVESSSVRARIAQERLRRIGANPAHYQIVEGSLSDTSVQTALNGTLTDPRGTRKTTDTEMKPGAIGMCITNIPYFGGPFNPISESVESSTPSLKPPSANHSPHQTSSPIRQLYAHQYYEPFLQSLREVFNHVHQRLAHDGWCIVMVQNLRLGGKFIPQAWDVARLLADRFDLYDERLLVYDKAATAPFGSAQISNRAHEYALIFKKHRPAIDVSNALMWLAQLQEAGFSFKVIGSLNRLLSGESLEPAHDIDIELEADDAELSRLILLLEESGFRIESWNTALHPPVVCLALAHRHYLRARQINRAGQVLQVDIQCRPSTD